MFVLERNMINSISFGAKKIGTTNVLKLSGNEYLPYSADVVKLNLNRVSDFRKFLQIKDNWNTYIIEKMYQICTSISLHFIKKQNIFIISEPQKYGKNDFFDPAKVLGITLFEQFPLRKYNVLTILQTNPKYKFGTKNSKFKHIGQSLFDFLKNTFNKKAFKLESSDEGRNFYIKNGLKISGKNFIWEGTNKVLI